MGEHLEKKLENYLNFYVSMTGSEGIPVPLRAHNSLKKSSVLSKDIAEPKGQGKPDSMISVTSETLPQSEAGQLEKLTQRLESEFSDQLLPGATKLVFGEGNPRARLMFIGEAPGADEDRLGRPFVGKAGQLLDKIIAAMGYSREKVYITNMVKCRPPENRAPLPNEIDAYMPILQEQISIIKPEIIVALGGISAKALLKKDLGITKLRGSFHELKVGGCKTRLMPTFHPAYLLRNPSSKKQVWEDMQKVMRELEKQ